MMLDALDSCLVAEILMNLELPEAVRLSRVSKRWKANLDGEELQGLFWRRKVAEISTDAWPSASNDIPLANNGDASYRHRYSDLYRVSNAMSPEWKERIPLNHKSTVGQRQGSACCTFDGSYFIYGGWTNTYDTIRNDVHRLVVIPEEVVDEERARRREWEAEWTKRAAECEESRAGGPTTRGKAAAKGTFRSALSTPGHPGPKGPDFPVAGGVTFWEKLFIKGNPPPSSYGATITACEGEDERCMVVIGGVTMGGYTGPTSQMRVLMRRRERRRERGVAEGEQKEEEEENEENKEGGKAEGKDCVEDAEEMGEEEDGRGGCEVGSRQKQDEEMWRKGIRSAEEGMRRRRAFIQGRVERAEAKRRMEREEARQKSKAKAMDKEKSTVKGKGKGKGKGKDKRVEVDGSGGAASKRPFQGRGGSGARGGGGGGTSGSGDAGGSSSVNGGGSSSGAAGASVDVPPADAIEQLTWVKQRLDSLNEESADLQQQLEKQAYVKDQDERAELVASLRQRVGELEKQSLELARKNAEIEEEWEIVEARRLHVRHA